MRNSWQLGGACLLMRSYSDLQSVVIIDWALVGKVDNACCTVDDKGFSDGSSAGGMAAKAGGRCNSV